MGRSALEVSLRVVARRADRRGALADVDVSAVAADPHGLLAGLEHDVLLEVLQQLAVTLLVGLLNSRDKAHGRRDLREALFLGHVGELLVHLGPLVVLARGRVLEVLRGGRNAAVMQQLEPQLRVLLLVVGRLLEDGRNLLITVLLGLGRVVAVLVSRLGLARKRREQVGFRSASLQFHFHFLLVNFWGFLFCPVNLSLVYPIFSQ